MLHYKSSFIGIRWIMETQHKLCETQSGGISGSILYMPLSLIEENIAETRATITDLHVGIEGHRIV